MSRIILTMLMCVWSFCSFSQDLALDGFNKRFEIVKNPEGKIIAIKLKKAVTRFTIRPFIEQIKNDLKKEQSSLALMNEVEKEAQVDAMLEDLGYSAYALHGGEGKKEAQKVKESILNVPNIDVEAAFMELDKADFWAEFERKLHEAMMFIDPTILANLDDARFFYKRQVTYKVVVWALEQAKKRFSNIPILNIASFVIVRVHDMMLEQRHFHHNMLLHYFETIPETKLGMTKEEVDRTVSSIYEYRIDAMDFLTSNAAAKDWMNFGMNSFYRQVRAGNNKMESWRSGMSSTRFEEMKKLNFAFAQVKEAEAQKIYHLHHNMHQFSRKPSLAYDFSNPKKVKNNRALLNVAGIALGFIKMPGWLKSNVDNFIKSIYVQQVRTEGALVGHFETMGDPEMVRSVYSQRANFYIVE